jgi:hypothetical protein
MKRREFITLLGAAAAAWPLAARAQQAGKLPTIGFLGAATALNWSPWLAAFVQRLRELGWIEGRTIAIEIRWAEGRSERYTESRPSSSASKSMSLLRRERRCSQQRRRHRLSRSCSQRQTTRLVAASSPVWRDRAAT